jgi:predicted DNA-binding protein
MRTTYSKQIACYVTPAQHVQLKQLSKATRVPIQAYLREAIEDMLKKYVKAPKR